MALLDDLKLSDLGLQSRIEALLDAPAELLLQNGCCCTRLFIVSGPSNIWRSKWFRGIHDDHGGCRGGCWWGTIVCVDPSR